MNFQSIGQTVKGHSGELGGKSEAKTEQSGKVRTKPVGRFQLGPKMQLSLFAPMTTYLKDLTQSIGRYGGLSWQNWFKGVWKHK